jgi:large subunit ribosomal protein L10
MAFDRGLEYKVYKNTLIKKALDTLEADTTALAEVLKGSSGILFSTESGNAPAKLIKDFRKKGHALPLLKGAFIDSGIYVGENQLDTLSTIKSKFELIADVIALLQSPAKNVISGLQGGGNKLAGILKTLSEKE